MTLVYNIHLDETYMHVVGHFLLANLHFIHDLYALSCSLTAPAHVQSLRKEEITLYVLDINNKLGMNEVNLMHVLCLHTGLYFLTKFHFCFYWDA